MAEKLDAEKKELILGLNSFNQPAETSGVEAWVKLITNLLFMRKGSYPTDPEMGCEIQKYEYSFIDDVRDDIMNLINDQVRKYLPDIPFDSATVTTSTSDSGKVILLIILQFTYNGGMDTAVVASENSKNYINFEVVF